MSPSIFCFSDMRALMKSKSTINNESQTYTQAYTFPHSSAPLSRCCLKYRFCGYIFVVYYLLVYAKIVRMMRICFVVCVCMYVFVGKRILNTKRLQRAVKGPQWSWKSHMYIYIHTYMNTNNEKKTIKALPTDMSILILTQNMSWGMETIPWRKRRRFM